MVKLHERMMERVHSGISKLDEMMGGGFPKGLNILVIGGTGVGKTIFCAQFLYRGLRDYGENGVYLALEERREDLRNDMLSLGLDLKKYEDEGKLIIIDATPAPFRLRDRREKYTIPRIFDIDSLVTEIYRAIRATDAHRVVIDSICGLEMHFPEFSVFRRSVYRLGNLLSSLEITSLITTQFSHLGKWVSRYMGEELLCQGIIDLYLEEEFSDLKRYLRIRKMAGTPHSMRKVKFEIETWHEGIRII